MSKHTPGPWMAVHLADNHLWTVVTDWTNLEHDVPSGEIRNIGAGVANVFGVKGECEANARLIAAAPDLLAALNELLEICRYKCSPHDEVILPNGRTNHEALVNACAVLAKAEAQP